MKRLFYIALAIGVLLGLYGTEVFGQSCYSSSYGQPQAYAEPFALSAQTQTVEVPVRVTVSIPQVQVSAPAPQPVAAPAPCQQSYAAPVAAPMCGAVGYAAPVALPFVAAVPSYGFSAGFSYGHHYGVNRGFVGHSRGFVGNAFGAIGGGGSNIVARDRRGTAVNANFNNNVKIRRGLFGNIREVTADANRGLLGRVSPF